jgi:hypothetical protein
MKRAKIFIMVVLASVCLTNCTKTTASPKEIKNPITVEIIDSLMNSWCSVYANNQVVFSNDSLWQGDSLHLAAYFGEVDTFIVVPDSAHLQANGDEFQADTIALPGLVWRLKF